MDKRALARSVIAQLEAELARQTEAAHGSRAEATDAENKSENKYDMRSQSAAYLAAGQARLATELAAALDAWRVFPLGAFADGQAIAVGALVTLEGDGRGAAYLVGPLSGGLEARDGEGSATVVTPLSPLGRQLVGRRAGETVVLPGGRGSIAHRIAGVE
jgi:transcription elongation GreA/GreB family factor